MTAETDLLPCPFCGGAPSVRVPEATDGYATHVACRCGASLYGARRHFSSTEEAIAAWNARACVSSATEALRAEVERLAEYARLADEANANLRTFVKVEEARTAAAEARAERLAEALREIAHAEEGDSLIGQIARAALEQETTNG